MINKKIVLSLFIMAFVGVGAASGTWAIYQDTINNNGDGFNLAAWGITVQAADDSGTLANIPISNGVANIDDYVWPTALIPAPAANDYVLKTVKFTNTGIPAHITVTGAKQDSLVIPAGMILKVDGQTLYDGTWHTLSINLPVGTHIQGDGYTSTDASVKLNFDSTSITNDQQGEHFRFDVKYVVTPGAI